MIFRAFSDGRFEIGDRLVRCALGRGGVCEASDKQEGDGRTPAGVWPLRRLMVRDDRLGPLRTALPRQALRPDDGWCDDPADPAYNQPVRHPYAASAERLWRDDRVYDAILVLGYNDDPPQPARGSAIFLHAARPDFSATEGCVALAIEDLVRLIGLAAPGDAVEILRA